MKQLYYYVIIMLTDDTNDPIFIQNGFNCVSNKNSNPEDIFKAVGSLGNLCHSHRVNQVLISLLICRRNFHLKLLALILTLIFYLS